MTQQSDIWFPLYFWDLERDAAHLDDAMRYRYLRLLAHMYARGGYLPDSDQALATLAGMSLRAWRRLYELDTAESAATVRWHQRASENACSRGHVFVGHRGGLLRYENTERGGSYTQDRVLRELLKRKEFAARQKQNASSRWVDAKPMPEACPRARNHQPSTNNSTTNASVEFERSRSREGKERARCALVSPPEFRQVKSEVEDVMALLREKTGRRFHVERPNGEPTHGAEQIAAALVAGYDVSDLRAVVAIKAREWRDGGMAANLRPGVLFGDKLDDYIGQLAGEDADRG